MAPDANRACAAVLRGSSILMVHHVHDGRDYWTLPGGGVETAAEAAVRELMEETGAWLTPAGFPLAPPPSARRADAGLGLAAGPLRYRRGHDLVSRPRFSARSLNQR
jgi:8-oxo-dGTP pyrophosphatase MutT (NUDIX family)